MPADVSALPTTAAAAAAPSLPLPLLPQVSRPMAQILAGLGLYANAMGGTTDLDPATYTFSGNAKRGIR